MTQDIAHIGIDFLHIIHLVQRLLMISHSIHRDRQRHRIHESDLGRLHLIRLHTSGTVEADVVPDDDLFRRDLSDGNEVFASRNIGDVGAVD